MNSLSWLLYFADVASNFNVLGFFVIVALMLFTVVAAVVGAAMRAEGDDDEQDAGKKLHSNLWKPVFAAAVVGVILVITPSKNTIMLIAASEFAGQVAQLDSTKQTAGEVGALASDSIALLHKYVTEQLATTPAK